MIESIMVIGAVLLVGLIIVGTGVLLHVGHHFRSIVVSLFVPLIALSIVASTLLTHRNLAFAAINVELMTSEPSAGVAIVLRLISLALVGFSLSILVTRLFSQKQKQATGWLLFVSFAVYFLTNLIANAVFGSVPKLVHNNLYALPVLLACFIVNGETTESLVRYAKYALIAIMFASIAFIPILPDVTLQKGYKGFLPGINFRLWGVGSHANSLGPLALVSLILLMAQPISRRWIHNCALILTLAVFILAQSKTAIVAAFFALPVMIYYRYPGLLRISSEKRGTSLLAILLFGIIPLALAILFLSAMFMDLGSLSHALARFGDDSQISTLTGRDVIWRVAIDEWLRNPAFGYGPTMWDMDYRDRIGLAYAFSAHNQFLQSLGSAGLIGLAGFLFYLSVLGHFAIAAAKQTTGASLAIYLVVLLRSISEAPFALSTILNGDFLVHFLLFAIILPIPSLQCRNQIGRNRATMVASDNSGMNMHIANRVF